MRISNKHTRLVPLNEVPIGTVFRIPEIHKDGIFMRIYAAGNEDENVTLIRYIRLSGEPKTNETRSGYAGGSYSMVWDNMTPEHRARHSVQVLNVELTIL